MIVLNEGEYAWFMVKASGDLYVEVGSGEDRRFSMYILNLDDSMRFLEEASLANSTPVYSSQSIETFAGVVDIPTPGYYGLVFEAFDGSMTVSLNIRIVRATPHLAVISIGVVMLVAGASVLLWTRAREAHARTAPSGMQSA